MLRIETELDGARTILRLIGRVHSNCIEDLRQQIENQASSIILDLAEVDLVDLPSVRFLRDCQDQEIELRNGIIYLTKVSNNGTLFKYRPEAVSVSIYKPQDTASRKEAYDSYRSF